MKMKMKEKERRVKEKKRKESLNDTNKIDDVDVYVCRVCICHLCLLLDQPRVSVTELS